MRRGGVGLLQVVGRQGGCVECIWSLSRFISMVGVEGGEAGAAAPSGLEGSQEKGAELEVFAAGIANDADEFDGLAIAVVACVQFVFAFANAPGYALEGVFKAVADLFFEEVPLQAAQALNLFDGFVVPAAQGGARDVEAGGDGVEGKAFGAKFDELVFGFVVVHRSGELKVVAGKQEVWNETRPELTRIRATGLGELASPRKNRKFQTPSTREAPGSNALDGNSGNLRFLRRNGAEAE
jgi:hypothetical protein